MARKDIKTWVNDLRITEDNIGGFLTVDQKCNPVWSSGPSQTAGEVWIYNQLDQDCYIQLPRADTNVGKCVAILRGKTTENKNAHIIIIPSNIGTSDNPIWDNIQDGIYYYKSSGINEDLTIVDDTDMYASIIFKSVYNNTTKKYNWIIINGVGSWNGEEFNISIYNNIVNSNIFTKQIISTQTAGTNTLTSGIGQSLSEFVPLSNFTEKLQVKKNSSASGLNLEPYNNNDPLHFIIGNFTNTTDPDYYYTQNISVASFNYFGKTPNLKNTYYSAETINYNNLNNYINCLGYIWNYNNTAPDWCKGREKNSFNYKLNSNKIRMISGEAVNINRIGSFQIIIPIKFSNLNLKDGYILTEIQKIYTYIQSYTENNRDGNWICYQNYIFKVPANIWSASEIKNTSDIIPISSKLEGYNYGPDNGFGQLFGIPVTTDDITNGGFNLVLEFEADTETIYNTEDKFKSNTIFCDDYVQLRFLGIEQIKTVSISPDLSVESLAFRTNENIGTLSGTEITNAFISSVTKHTDFSTESNFSSLIPTTGAFTKSFFNSSGRYKPTNINGIEDKDITKTIIRIDGENYQSGKFNSNITQLEIDWANLTWNLTLSGVISNGSIGILTAQTGSFSNEDISLTVQNGSTAYILKNCLNVNSLGISKIPFLTGTSTTRVTFNITHYKTVISTKNKFFEELINYKCGWERAESIWQTTMKADGSERDGLLSSDITIIEDETQSPSKANIICPHKRIKIPNNDVNQLTDNYLKNTPEYEDNTGLLPYVVKDSWLSSSTEGNELRYFSLMPRELLANSGSIAYKRLASNEFVILKANPTISGTLFGRIQYPMTGTIAIPFSYIIFREDEYKNLILIKENQKSTISASGANSGLIEFNDTVSAGFEYNYHIFLYIPVFHHIGVENYDPWNVIIARHSNSDGNIYSESFKTYFDKKYYSRWGLGRNVEGDSTAYCKYLHNPSNKISSIMEEMHVNQGYEGTLDATELLDKIAKLLFDDSFNSTTDLTLVENRGKTTHKNWGETFEFHMYVLGK